jgi:hypothetical protein
VGGGPFAYFAVLGEDPGMLLLLFIEPRPARSVHPISSKRFAMLLKAVLISIAIRTGMVGAVVA